MAAPVESTPAVQETSETSSTALTSVTILYGSITLILMLIYGLVKNRYKRLFNVRNSVPRLQCELAKQEYGLFGWIPGVLRVKVASRHFRRAMSVTDVADALLMTLPGRGPF
eukprot:1402786-Rhodomonas_salina.4